MEQELFDILSDLEMRNEKEKMRGGDGIQAMDPDSAKLISTLAVSKQAKLIVEVGGGVGYSTLWLAYAVAMTGGKVVSCEIDPDKAAQALDNLKKANLADYVELLIGDAREVLRNREGTVDFLLIDGDYGQYETYFDVVYKRMEVGGMIVADDVVEEENALSDYVSYMQNHPNLESTTVPLGDGLEITVKTLA
ncbi:O-methyltransferase [Anaerolineales bacterium HSG6]|nr:O-methyltransferase [Anaerolineales bacterium HSG6]